MFNKQAAFLPEDGRHLTEGRTHCVLLGDGVGDLTMADGLAVDTLKVGFLNEKVDEKLAQFEKLFDAVVVEDGAMPELCFRAIGAKSERCLQR